MAYQPLNIDKRFTTNGKASHIKEDNSIKMPVYLQTFLKEFANQMPIYADNAAAVAAGEPVGTWYKTAIGAVLVVV